MDKTENILENMAIEGATHYERKRRLPKLISIQEDELNDFSERGCKIIVGLLNAAFEAEKKRWLTGHWCGDKNRMLAVQSALIAEKAYLENLKNG